MTEIQKLFGNLTQLLDSFLQGLVQCNLVSGYSLSLSTYPESFTSSNKTLPLFLTLLQQLQDGVKKLLILYDSKESQGTKCPSVHQELVLQESSANNSQFHTAEQRDITRDSEGCDNTKETPVAEEIETPSHVSIDIENQNSDSNSYDDIRKHGEPKMGQDCIVKTDDMVQGEESSSLEQQLVVVDNEVQVFMEEHQSQVLAPKPEDTLVVVHESAEERATEEIDPLPTSQCHLNEESTLEVPEPTGNNNVIEKEEIQVQFKCSKCPREFKSASTLETHRMKFHTAPQSCDMCGQTLGSTAALQEHCRAVHDGVGCFQCSICKRRFMLRLSYRRHLETHEPATTMAVCEICGKSFRRADYLQRHYLSHTGQRSHVCSICKKSFLCTSHLKNHMTALHNTQSYPCDMCGRNFSRPDKLKEHHLRHYNIKRHSCSQCGKEYAERRDLKKHLELCNKVTTDDIG